MLRAPPRVPAAPAVLRDLQPPAVRMSSRDRGCPVSRPVIRCGSRCRRPRRPPTGSRGRAVLRSPSHRRLPAPNSRVRHRPSRLSPARRVGRPGRAAPGRGRLRRPCRSSPVRRLTGRPLPSTAARGSPLSRPSRAGRAGRPRRIRLRPRRKRRVRRRPYGRTSPARLLRPVRPLIRDPPRRVHRALRPRRPSRGVPVRRHRPISRARWGSRRRRPPLVPFPVPVPRPVRVLQVPLPALVLLAPLPASALCPSTVGLPSRRRPRQVRGWRWSRRIASTSRR